MSDSTIRAAIITGIFAIIVVVIGGIFGFWEGVFANGNNITTATSTPTHSIPLVFAQLNVNVHSGASADTDVVMVLTAGSSLDVLGIDPTQSWYQVLLPNGAKGWVTTSSVSTRLEGSRAVLSVLALTSVPSPTPSETMTPTSTVTLTATSSATNTNEPTATQTASHPPTETYTPTIGLTPSNTTEFTPTPRLSTATQTYPCEAIVDPNSQASLLNVVRQTANPNSAIIDSIRRNETVMVIEASIGDETHYRVQSNGQTLGWVSEKYLLLSYNCPNEG